METFPNVWTQFFPPCFKYHFIEANTRLGPGCLRSLLGFTMLLSLSCQRKMCFLPDFRAFHHAGIYFTQRCLLKMVLGCLWNFLRTNENTTKNQTCYLMNATLTTSTSLKTVAMVRFNGHIVTPVNRVTMASTPNPRSCISAWNFAIKNNHNNLTDVFWTKELND